MSFSIAMVLYIPLWVSFTASCPLPATVLKHQLSLHLFALKGQKGLFLIFHLYVFSLPLLWTHACATNILWTHPIMLSPTTSIRYGMPYSDQDWTSESVSHWVLKVRWIKYNQKPNMSFIPSLHPWPLYPFAMRSVSESDGILTHTPFIQTYSIARLPMVLTC